MFFFCTKNVFSKHRGPCWLLALTGFGSKPSIGNPSLVNGSGVSETTIKSRELLYQMMNAITIAINDNNLDVAISRIDELITFATSHFFTMRELNQIKILMTDLLGDNFGISWEQDLSPSIKDKLSKLRVKVLELARDLAVMEDASTIYDTQAISDPFIELLEAAAEGEFALQVVVDQSPSVTVARQFTGPTLEHSVLPNAGSSMVPVFRSLHSTEFERTANDLLRGLD